MPFAPYACFYDLLYAASPMILSYHTDWQVFAPELALMSPFPFLSLSLILDFVSVAEWS